MPWPDGPRLKRCVLGKPIRHDNNDISWLRTCKLCDYESPSLISPCVSLSEKAVSPFPQLFVFASVYNSYIYQFYLQSFVQNSTMAAAVMQPLSAMSLDREIMAPSPISNNQSRHGRGKHGGSISNNKKTRQRGYSIIAERDSTVTRALTKLLKRSGEQDQEQEDDSEKPVPDSEGWFKCEKVVSTNGLNFRPLVVSESACPTNTSFSKDRII